MDDPMVLSRMFGNQSKSVSYWADALINLEWGHPQQERTRAEWLALFAHCGLNVQHEQGWTSRYGVRVAHTLFVLERGAGREVGAG